MQIIISLISILLDLFFTNIINNSNGLSYLFPMFTITSIVYFSNKYNYSERNKYYLYVLFISIIYDCFFVNNLFISIFLFEFIAFINVKLDSSFKNNFFFYIMKLFMSIIIYDFCFYLLLIIARVDFFNINKLIYKVSHSLIINIIYITLLFFVLKTKKRNIN